MLGAVGCATVSLPEVGTEFRDWEFSVTETSFFELPQEPEVAELDGGVWMTDAEFAKHVLFVESSYSNLELLKIRNQQIAKLEQQITQLVLAGMSTEQVAELYSHLYAQEVQSCRWIRLGVSAGASAILVATGIGGL